MTQSVSLSTQLERNCISPSGGTIYLLVSIAAPQAETGGRLPLNLAAVVDRSGSMAGAKLAYTKQALRFLVDQLAEADRLAVVTYDDEVEVRLPSQSISQKDAVKTLLALIEAGGTTNLSGGVATGMQQIGPHAGPERVSRLLLMTDGLANVGVTDPDTLVGWVKAWRERGLALSSLGVGNDFNEDLLVAMAEAGGGSFHYIADPDQIPAIFADELQGLLQVAAQGMQLRVEAEPGVAVTEVIGYQPSGTPHRVDVTLPDLYGAEVKSLLIKLVVAAPPADGKLAKVTLHYLPATAGAAPSTLSAEVKLSVTDDPAKLAAPPNEEVVRQVRLSEAGAAWDEAVRMADEGDMHGAALHLHAAAQTLAFQAQAGDKEASERMEALRTQAEAMRSAPYSAAMRKQMRQESFRNRRGR